MTNDRIIDFHENGTRKFHNSLINGDDTDAGEFIGIDADVDFDTFVNARKNKEGSWASNFLSFPKSENNESLEITYKLQQ